jgi:ketosteroid isomerase-like protein
VLLYSALPVRAATAQSTSDITGVQAASQAFYKALAMHDKGKAMAGVWAHTPYVTNIGPRSSSVAVGWDAVSKYWEEFDDVFTSVDVTLSESHLHVNGELAWEIGEEIGKATMKNGAVRKIDHLATNVFEKINGQWLMVSHHANRKPE